MDKTKVEKYQFDFAKFTVGDMILLHHTALLIQAGFTPPMVANQFIDIIKRFALFDLDSQPMDCLSIIIDDFASAYKKHYEGLRD